MIDTEYHYSVLICWVACVMPYLARPEKIFTLVVKEVFMIFDVFQHHFWVTFINPIKNT